MQQSQARDNGDMSWARAIVLATGFFFLSAIYLGQIPGFFSLVFTQATLGRMEQSMLELGVLALGLGLIGITASMIYDPKPVTRLFVPLFGMLGLALMAVGAFFMMMVLTGQWHEFLPDQTVTVLGPGQINITNWPIPSQSYLFNPAWFQPQSIDIGALGFVLFAIGGGVFSTVALFPLHTSGKLNGPLRNLIVQMGTGGAGALVLAYLTIYTFSPAATTGTYASGAFENIALALALFLVLFALQVWLLPVMTAKENRARFMPALYLHSVQLIASVAAPLLILFVAVMPVVNWMFSVDLSNGYWVQCAVKSNIPGSCTFTPYIGYIVAGVVSGMLFTFLIAAGYLWNRKPAFVRLGSVFGFVFAALAVAATHTTDPKQTPVALSIGIGVAILGLVWTISTQKEFVPAEMRNVALGCTGQWLVMGTLLLIYIGSFGFFSFPSFIETESNIIISPGPHTIHDAYWVMLIGSSLAAIQFAFLMRRQPLGSLRKLTLWLVLVGAGMQVASSIHFSLHTFNLVNIAYYSGIGIEVLGIVLGILCGLLTRERGGIGFVVLMLAAAIVSAFLAVFWFTINYDELVVAFSVLMGAGAIIYTIYGGDPPEPNFMARMSARGTLPRARGGSLTAPTE